MESSEPERVHDRVLRHHLLQVCFSGDLPEVLSVAPTRNQCIHRSSTEGGSESFDRPTWQDPGRFLGEGETFRPSHVSHEDDHEWP